MQTSVDHDQLTVRRRRGLRWIGGRRSLRDERGSVAIEFAIIAPIFIALTFATLEVGVTFFANQYLESAVNDSARLIRTGQAQKRSYSADQFKTEICDRLVVFFSNCKTKLKLDVRTSATFGSADINKPVDSNGNFNGRQIFNPGSGTQLVIVRAYYEWPLYATGFGLDLADVPGTNTRLLASVAAFRNEPFPW